MKKITRSIFLFLILVGSLVTPVSAKGNAGPGPIYRIQAGDTLWAIANKLHVPLDSLLAVNDINENSVIIPGTQLVVPGLEEYSGELDVIEVPYGESLQSLSRRYQIPEQALIRLNRMTSPLELYAGASAVLVGQNGVTEQAGARKTLAPGQSVLELAVQAGVNPWYLIAANSEAGSWDVIPGEVLFIPGMESGTPGGFPEEFRVASNSPLQLVQGHTSEIRFKASPGIEISGTLGDYPLTFFNLDEETYVALQGLHAQEPIGVKELSVFGTLPDGTPFAHTQMVRVRDGRFLYEDVVGVSQDLIGGGINEEETQKLKKYTDIATPTKYWSGQFVSPVDPRFIGAYASYFGTRRSYNGSDYNYFHTGLDYFNSLGEYVCTNIYAAAPGKVAFVGPMTVHGNTTLIDHGWGVYTLYAHQSQILVQQGQQVNAGDLIGYVGSTGRSVEPHLHFEVWVGGLQVDPLDWLEKTYP